MNSRTGPNRAGSHQTIPVCTGRKGLQRRKKKKGPARVNPLLRQDISSIAHMKVPLKRYCFIDF